jgi:2-polyprenyl-6-methoxyphenol hydroxylase-like FAD-dependent oxidoreductase
MEKPMETVKSTNQVLIVGAGPTGLMAAAQLLRWGIRPRIIEANAGPNLQTRALGVQARSMEIYRQMGLEAEVFARGLPTEYAAMYTERGELGRIPMQDIGAGLSPYPYMFILPQDQNERVLGDDLKRHGLAVDWNTSLKGLENTASGVTVTLETPDGMETATFRYVIGADGARSAVRKALGIEFAGSTDEEHKFFVADLRAEGELTPGALCLYMSHKYHVLALFPMPGEQRFRLIGMLPDDLVQRQDLSFADLQPKLREMVGQRLQFNDASWFSTYSVHHRVAVQFKKGNGFLVGDAAHVHSPVGGQGMNTGLQDAYNLAWKLALVLRGQANEQLLETYHDERYPNAMSLINSTDRAFSVLVSSHPFARFMIDWVVPRLAPIALKNKRLQKRFFMSFSQTGLNYRHRKLSREHLHGQIKAGDRFPWFSDNDQDVFQKMTGTRFTLFALGDWSTHKPQLETLRSSLLEVVCIPNQGAYQKTGLTDGLYLVRPDGYIGLSTKDPDEIPLYLSQTVGLDVARTRVQDAGARPILGT